MASEMHVGDEFSSFQEIQDSLDIYMKKNYVQFYKRNSRTIAGFKKHFPSKTCIEIPDCLKYGEIDFHCIHGGKKYKSNAVTRGKQSTFRMDCKACIKFRLSEDGQKLHIVHLNEDHSHCVTKESFMHLPHQRRLDEEEKDAVAQMLAVKANKKMIQQHMIESTGKVITMKDIQNANQSCLNHGNDLITLLNEMRKEKGSITEVVVGEDNQLRGIYYQQREMVKVFSCYPEVLLLDATYKLNNLRMPLYVLMCVDGNGESVVVALWIVANEERETIGALADIFTKHNEISRVQVVMADKDMVERDVMSEKIPNASLQICLFHTLRIFRREVTSEKLGLKAEQRLVVLELLEKIVYSANEFDYFKHYKSLGALELDTVMEYFNVNWHDIRLQWVEGLKRQSLNLLNSTTNRVECINQKLKSVITKYSGMVTFFTDLMLILRVLETERRHRAMHIIHKSSAHLMSSDQQDYSAIVTPFAMKHISSQMAAAEKCTSIPMKPLVMPAAVDLSRQWVFPASTSSDLE